MASPLTPSQERIVELLHRQEQPLSAQAIYMELRRNQYRVGLATVYRALGALKVMGIVQATPLPTGEMVYGCLHQDRHHLTCLQCGTSVPVEDCPVQAMENDLQASHRFRIFYHTLEFFGLCGQCQT